MAFELVYTSAPRGIKPGSSGFCTVAYTNGLAANTAVQLEALSAYKAYFPPYDDHASQNPVAYSHYRVISSGEELHVLSRICFNGLDYTKRSNKLAHHLVLRQHDLARRRLGPRRFFSSPDSFFAHGTANRYSSPGKKISPPQTPALARQLLGKPTRVTPAGLAPSSNATCKRPTGQCTSSSIRSNTTMCSHCSPKPHCCFPQPTAGS